MVIKNYKFKILFNISFLISCLGCTADFYRATGMADPIYKKTFLDEKALNSEIKIVDVHEVRWYLVCGQETLVLPIPSKLDSILKQSLIFKGEEIWSFDFEVEQKYHSKVFFVSPNGKYVYIEDSSSLAPSQILLVKERLTKKIRLPEIIKDYSYKYPLEYCKWLEDSSGVKCRSCVVKVNNSFVNGEWVIDPRDGKATELWSEQSKDMYGISHECETENENGVEP
jgi:hypothetical protein